MDLFRRRNSPIASPDHFGALYEQNRLSVFRYVYALTGGPQDVAEDLTAETFLRAWKARRRFEGDMESATGWLIRIARRLVIDEYRRSLHTTRNLSIEPEPVPMPEQVALAGERDRFLLSLLADLPEEQREIIILRHVLGWRVNEIAQHVGTTENNISVMIHRTLLKLKDKWLEADPESLLLEFAREEKIP